MHAGRFAMFALIALRVLAAPAHAAPHPPRPAPHPQRPAPPSSPAAPLGGLKRAYEAKSVDGVDALLTSDFRFHFAQGDSAGINLAAYGIAWDRDHEMTSTRAMLVGGVAGAGMAPPDSIVLNCGTIDEGVDPEHPDSTCQYRLLVVHDFHLHLAMPKHGTDEKRDVFDTRPGLQVFSVVRGDAAVRMPGQSADTTRWYIRGWLEDLDAITLALGTAEGECEAESPAPLAFAPAALGLRVANAPLCPTLKVLCDLPEGGSAHLEVFDLMGRRVASRDVATSSPGTRLVEAGDGRRFAPGLYMVRLTQPGHAPITRRVMVAR